MINDKKIDEAANEICDYGSIYDSDYRINGFKKGAKWAINEFLKDLWHYANEEPEINKEILVDWRTENRSIMFLQTKLNNWKKLSNQEIKRWLYIDDLLLK